MDRVEALKPVSPVVERLALQRARDRANVAKWGFNVAIFSYAILIVIIILVSQGIGLNIVATLAALGLVSIWVMGWRQGNQLSQRFYDEELSSLQQKPTKEATDLAVGLTSREIQILNYAAQGFANKHIAFELGISENTVKHFISGVLTKLNADDRTEAVVIAIKHGLVSIR